MVFFSPAARSAVRCRTRHTRIVYLLKIWGGRIRGSSRSPTTCATSLVEHRQHSRPGAARRPLHRGRVHRRRTRCPVRHLLRGRAETRRIFWSTGNARRVIDDQPQEKSTPRSSSPPTSPGCSSAISTNSSRTPGSVGPIPSPGALFLTHASRALSWARVTQHRSGPGSSRTSNKIRRHGRGEAGQQGLVHVTDEVGTHRLAQAVERAVGEQDGPLLPRLGSYPCSASRSRPRHRVSAAVAAAPRTGGVIVPGRRPHAPGPR